MAVLNAWFRRNGPTGTSTRPQALFLVMMQALCVIVAITVVAMYIAGIPVHIRRLTRPTTVPINAEYVAARAAWGAPVDSWKAPDTAYQEALEELGWTMSERANFLVGIELLVGLSLFAAAIVIFVRRPNDWVALLVALLFVSYGSTEIDFTATLETQSMAWFWTANAVQALGEFISLIVFYVFPDGRFVPRWTRYSAALYGALLVVWFFVPWLAFNPVYGFTFDRTPPQSTILIVGWHLLGLYTLMYRYRRVTDLTMHRQMQWVLAGLGTGMVVGAVRYSVQALVEQFNLLHTPIQLVIYDLTLRPIQWIVLDVVLLCFAVAVLRHQLWDIKVVVKQTLVYGSLSVAVVCLYGTIVGILSAFFNIHNDWFWSMISTGVIAVLLHPMRDRLQRSVDVLIYGDEQLAYRELEQLNVQLKNTMSPKDMARAVVTTMTRALRIPYAAVSLGGTDVPVAEAGTTVSHSDSIHLTVDGQTIGKIIVGLPADRLALTDRERHLLRQLAHQLASVLHVQHLAGELHQANLQLSQTNAELTRVNIQLLQANEEIRQARTTRVKEIEMRLKRLQKDLHDGALHYMTLITWSLKRKVLPAVEHDPAEVRRQVQEVLDEVDEAQKLAKAIIYELRPPIIDQGGVHMALNHLAEQHAIPPLRVYAFTPSDLPLLHPALDKAIYLIAREALTNVIKYAEADTCSLRLSVNESTITLTVSDNGKGITPGTPPGVGINSMRTRVEELGGMWSVSDKPNGGTMIVAQFPVIPPDQPSMEERNSGANLST